jgi:L-seryl-tRNA(Ser) seleniumtransferase
VTLGELVEVGRAAGVPVMYDQGSGVLYPLRDAGIEGEESLETTLESGVDIVSFSTDKVLGGPQGGALVGGASLVARMKENHLSRALRPDKLALAGLEQALREYWSGGFEGIPSLGMIMEPQERLRERAVRIAGSVASRVRGSDVTTAESESSIGGGSFPINPLRTVLVQITLPAGRAERFAARLRSGRPSVLVRVKDHSILIDPRTILGDEEDELVDLLVGGLEGILRRE